MARGSARVARSALCALASCVLALCIVARSGHARAERTRVVSIATTDGAPLDPALWETLRELFARVGVSVSAESGEHSAIVVRLAARQGGIDLVVTSPAHEPVHRRVDGAATDELFRETLGHVVLGIVEPLLDEPPPAPPPPPPPSTPEPEPAPVRAAPRALRLRIGAFAGPLLVARRSVVPRVGATVGVVLDRKLAPALALDAAYATGTRLERRSVEGRLHLASARVRPSIAWGTGRIALSADLPLGVDVAVLDVTAAPSDAASMARALAVDAALGAQLGGRLSLSSTLTLALSLGAELGLAPHRFVVRDAEHTATLAALDRVRPYLLLGLDWTSAHRARRSP